jgi:hypothetical protein
MAVEDKLSQEQRVRLESLHLALGYSPPETTSDALLAKAKTFEKYVRDGSTGE